MKISVIIPYFNRSKSISRAVDSVLVQDLLLLNKGVSLKIFIIDDGSSKEEKDLLFNLYNGDRDVSIVSYSPNRGANFARNYGVEHSLNSNYVLFLDSDECLKENFFSSIYNELMTGIDWVCSGFEVKSNFGYQVSFIKKFDGVNIPKYILRDGGHLKTSCMVFSISVLSTIKWDESLKRFQDLDLVLRLYLSGYHVKYIPKSLVICFKDEDNRISNGGGSNVLKEFLKKYTISIDNSLLNYYKYIRIPSILVEEGKYLEALHYTIFGDTGYGFNLKTRLNSLFVFFSSITVRFIKLFIR